MLTVLAWYWKQPEGRTQYTPLHVEIWSHMVRRHLSMPHRIAVVTDEPISIEGVEVIRPPSDFVDIRIPSWPEHRPQCLRRLSMFRPDAADWFGERFVCMDLDCVVGAPLGPLFRTDADFKMAVGTERSRPYNGSMMLMTAGARPQVYEQFTREGAIAAGSKFIGSDQAWLAYCLGPNEAKWTERDGLCYHGLPRPADVQRRISFFPGSKKPWDCSHDPWVKSNYRLSRAGRCLVLGYDDTLWSDVDRALDNGPYDAVIASPEAAEHWPGRILAVAKTNRDAANLAHLHGFDDVTWCGVKEREAA